MICEFFGVCGGCALPLEYDEQLAVKQSELIDLMADVDFAEPTIYKSKPSHFRNRAEFMVLRTESGFRLGMSPFGERKKIPVANCPITNNAFSSIVLELLDFLYVDDELSNRLFGINFLSNTNGSDLIVVLIYHRRLDEAFQVKLDLVRSTFGIDLIARSRGVKIVAGRDFVVEQIGNYHYKQIEGSFTQPNGGVNAQMIGWVLDNSFDSSSDLLELYCGNGNFTIALAERFRKVVAIEVAKSSLETARQNAALNGISNIFFIRMDAREFTGAYQKTREFFRLRELDLDSLNIKTVLVDPPRAGLDSNSLDLIRQFETIMYISCNPHTLIRDLKLLGANYKIEKTALFDQFAYTPHLEVGVILRRVVA